MSYKSLFKQNKKKEPQTSFIVQLIHPSGNSLVVCRLLQPQYMAPVSTVSQVPWRSMAWCDWDYSSYLSPSQQRNGGGTRSSQHPFEVGFMGDGVAMRHAMTNEVMRGEIEEKISATGSGPASSDGFHKSLLWPFPSRQESTQTRREVPVLSLLCGQQNCPGNKRQTVAYILKTSFSGYIDMSL